MDCPEELLAHLVSVSGLSTDQARRLVEETLSYFDETVEAFVERRHRELKAQGQRNPAIFGQLQGELRQRPFAAQALSERQLRRLIYG